MRPRLILFAAFATMAMAVAGAALAQVAATVPPRPVPGPAKPFVFPKIDVQTLPNGLRLAVIENHDLPIVAVRVGSAGGYFPGTFADPPGKEGTWNLMLRSMRDGTLMRSANAINEQAADLGTVIDYPDAPSSGFPSFTTVKSAWNPMLDLVADMLIHPSFPAEAVSRNQAALSVASRPVPGNVLLQIATPRVFGADHIYSRYFATDSSVRRITLQDVVAIHDTYVRPQNTVIVVSGDVSTAEARKAVDRAFSSWERGGNTMESVFRPPTIESQPTTIYLKDVPGSQVQFYAVARVPSRASPDAAAIEAVNAILGGANAGSRLYDAFRVKRGLSYSIFVTIQWARPEPQAANWIISTSAPSDKVDTAIVEWMRVLRDIHGDRPITSSELEFSRNNLVGALPAQLATVDAQATTTLTIIKNGLSPTFYADYVSRINALTLADVQAAAAKYLDPDHLTIVVTGDRAKIEAPLRASGIPVVIVP